MWARLEIIMPAVFANRRRSPHREPDSSQCRHATQIESGLTASMNLERDRNPRPTFRPLNEECNPSRGLGLLRQGTVLLRRSPLGR